MSVRFRSALTVSVAVHAVLGALLWAGLTGPTAEEFPSVTVRLSGAPPSPADPELPRFFPETFPTPAHGTARVVRAPRPERVSVPPRAEERAPRELFSVRPPDDWLASFRDGAFLADSAGLPAPEQVALQAAVREWNAAFVARMPEIRREMFQRAFQRTPFYRF